MTLICTEKNCSHYESYDDCVFKEIGCICAEEATAQVIKLQSQLKVMRDALETMTDRETCTECKCLAIAYKALKEVDSGKP
jgi:hypothetical protein